LVRKAAAAFKARAAGLRQRAFLPGATPDALPEAPETLPAALPGTAAESPTARCSARDRAC
jgi:hypothetical protein